jgi:hypothetical protein
LETAVAIVVAPVREQWPEIRPMQRTAGFGILFGQIREKKVKDSRAFAIQGVGVSAIAFVKRPEVKIALEDIVVSASE